MKATLIIAIYNKFEYLSLVLTALAKQSVTDFEVILADDGSNEDTTAKIEKFVKDLPFPVMHLWQEDKGFRKNRMLNRAITASETEYLIFIDGDCIPHSRFVEEHFRYAEPGCCLTGRRVNLSEKFTAGLTVEKIKTGWPENKLFSLILDGIFGKSYDVEKGFYIKNNFLRGKLNNKKRGILGCNFSLFKTDILNINGFDERYEAPSIGEDSDIQYRLELNNIKIKPVNNIAVQYHLYHKLQPRPEENLLLFEKVKEEMKFYTEYGINKS